MPRFTRIRLIRKAGQGEVWISLDEETGNTVAQKFLSLRGRDSADEIAVKRFEREVRSQSELIGSSIMPIIAFDFSEDPRWYAMPLASTSLEARLATQTPMSTLELSGLTSSVFDALDLAHKKLVVHRDLTPANILHLEGPGRRDWVVADFGLCRDVKSRNPTITRSGVELGTTRYMAPEQSEDPHNVGPTADIYSFGCVLYQCLTGELPGSRQLDYDKLPDEYREVIKKATSLHRNQRYLTARDFQHAFEGIDGLTNLPIAESSTRRIDAAVGRIAEIAASRVDLNDLTDEAFRSFVEDLVTTLGYVVVVSDTDKNVSFYVEDAKRGIGPVLARKRRYRSPSTDLISIQQAMAAQQSRFALYVSTGSLSAEARQFASVNSQIVTIDRASLNLHLESYRASLERVTTDPPINTRRSS